MQRRLVHQPRDGYADFYGYDEAEADGMIVSPNSCQNVFLPDRDPNDREKLWSPEESESFESTLIMLREHMQAKRDLISTAEGDDATGLKQELEHLKLQTARIAELLWNPEPDAEERRRSLRQLEEAAKFASQFGDIAKQFAADFEY